MPLLSADTDPADLSETAIAFSEGRVDRAAKPVRRIDTHLSHVFLTETLVYKLKRPVRFPYVDFSSMELRRAACEAELETNLRFGSPFYLDVLPVARRDRRFSLGGEGEVVDWVVTMRRFDQSQQFDELAAAGRLSVDLAIETADRIASLHAGAAANTLCGHAADYRQVIRNLRRTETGAAAKMGLVIADPSPFDELDAALARVGPLIEQRRSAGKVRRGHGDLHLRNLCLFEGRPQPFDALEFSDRLATTDVLYDLAFFLMDLRRAGLPEQANAAMNRYWDAAQEDEDALKLLPFFMGLRAAVRMAVALDAGRLLEANDYRILAFDLLAGGPAVAAAIGGLSGSGKSAVSAKLAPLLPGPARARVLRSDVLRKRGLGLAPKHKAPSDSYTPDRRAKVYRELCARAANAVGAGASVVVDATFAASETRKAIVSIPGATVHAFWLDAQLPVRLGRIAARPKGPSDADVDAARAQLAPVSLPALWTRIDAARPLEEVVADIFGRIEAAEGGAATSPRSAEA